jgi:hypothetical protein
MDLNEKYTFFVVMLVLRIIYFFCYRAQIFLFSNTEKK